MTREFYAIQYVKTDKKMKKDVVDKLVWSDDPKYVMETIRIYVREHPVYEVGTEIMKEVCSTISDAFVSYGEETTDWLIIHTFTKEEP